MKKTKFLSLAMSFLMFGSFYLSACTDVSNGANGSHGNSGNPNSNGGLFDDPEQDTVNGNGKGEFLSVNKKLTQDNKTAEAYRKVQEDAAMAAEGIGAEDYVWTIVSLPGDNMIERYSASRTSRSVAEYVNGAGKDERDGMIKQQQTIQERIRKYDANAEFAYSYTLAANGFAAKVKYGMLEQIRNIRGIESVSLSEQYANPEEQGVTLYSSEENSAYGAIAAEDTSGEERPGEGTFIAVLDTALDTTHSAFSGDCIDLEAAKVEKQDIAGVLESTDAYYWDYVYNLTSTRDILSADDVYVNDKLVFTYDYANKDPFVYPISGFESMLDHGTHTSGITVGNDEETGFKGVAPYAQLAFMKVFYEDTDDWVVYSKDIYIAAAIEDCIMLGVDAINLSLGTARGFSVDNSSENYIYQYCYYANLVGINVQASVGNGFTSAYKGVNGDYPLATNPDYGAVNSPASYASTLAIGSYDGKNVDQYYALVNGEKKVYYTDNADYTLISELGAGTYQWVYVSGDGTYADFEKANVKGKIAFVSINDNVDIANQMVNAMRANAKAIVFIDPGYYSASAVSCKIGNALPYCSMPLLYGEQMIALGSGTIQLNENQVAYNLMSVFSAWGPTNSLTLKPEVVAIGGSVYSTLISAERYGSTAQYYTTDYGYYSGTSMASPKATAYVARLKKQLKERYPEKSNVEIAKLVNQIVMSTANTLSDVNGLTYSPRYQGAGAIDYTSALSTPAYLSVVGTDKTKIELGEDAKKTGVYVLNFNVNNMDSQAHTYAISVETMTQALCGDGKTVSLVSYILKNCTSKIAISGTGCSLSGKNLTVAANGSASVAITLSLDATAKEYIDRNFAYGSYIEGFVSLTGNRNEATLSVPFLAFYGDWEKSALMDSSEYDEEEGAVYASKLTGTYNGGNSYIELGNYPYYDFDGEYSLTINGEDGKVVGVGYDADRLAIGSQTGGYYALAYAYVGLLRHADQLEFTISNAETGELYEYYVTEQIGKATYLESSGAMYPVTQGISYGASMPNNTYLEFTVRARLDNMGDTVNVKDSQSFIIAVDNEYPRMYSSSRGVYEGEDGRIYLSLDVYENNRLSCLWLYSYQEDGTTESLGAPIAVDTSKWIRGQKNNVTVDITDLIDQFPTNYLGVSLEDCSMNRAGYRVLIPGSISGSTDEDEGETGKYAETLTYDKTINIAVGYSTDLDIVTYPADAEYTLSVVEMEDKTKYCGVAEIDEERKLVVARSAGYVRIRIESGDISVESDVYVYVIDGEWVFEPNTVGWVHEYNEETGGWAVDKNFLYDAANPDKQYYIVYAYLGEGSHVEIPAYYVDGEGKSHEVVAIGQSAFAYCLNMYSVTIPNTIRRICYGAFTSNTALEEVIFEPGSQLREISSMAFEYDSALRSIEIPASCYQIASRAFSSCTALTSLTFEAMTQADGAKLRDIQFGAFMNTSLAELELPETVTSIASAFSGLPLKRVVLPESMTNCGSFANCTELEEVVLPSGVKNINSSTFKNCVALRKINLPDGLESIGSLAFYGCQSLTALDIPDSVTSIGSQAFAGCTRLVSARFGDALQTIGKEAFSGDVSLVSVSFGKGTNVSDWGDDVFYNCINLQQYNVNPANVNYMSDDGILYRVVSQGPREYELYRVPQSKSITELLVRPDVTSIADYAFTSHTELQTIFIPASGKLREIGDYAFAACTGLTVLNLENAGKLKELGEYSFAYCTALTSVSFPDSLTSIPAYAFYYNVDLATIDFPSNLQTIGGYAFAYCIDYKGDDHLGNLTLPASLTALGTGCFVYNRELRKVDLSNCTDFAGSNSSGGQFQSCFNLKEVVLPSSLVYISEYMFYGCTALEKINLEDTSLTTVRTYGFGYCESLKEVSFPSTLNYLYTYSFCGTGLRSVDMSNTSANIFAYSFALCADLETFVLPSGGSELSQYVFAESGLKEICIPASYETVNQAAFYLCNNLTRFVVEEGNPTYGATEEGILYTISSSTDGYGNLEQVYTLYILPLNLQTELLVIDEKFTSIPSAFFRLATGIEKVYIPATVTEVEAGAFYYSSVKEVEFASDSPVVFSESNYSIFTGCSELEKVVLPRHVDCIPSYMFAECTSLTEIDLPESVTSVSDYAFAYCSGLRSIDLSNVETIGGYAFAYCSALTELNFGARLTSVEFDATYTAFEGCSSLENVTVDRYNMMYQSIDGVLFDKTGTILYLYPAQKAGAEYAVPQGVTKINECAFAFNANLERIVLPKTLRTIGNAAFYQVEKLHRYVFLGDEAPLLEGIYNSSAATVLYANFYDFYFNDFGDFYCYMIVPEGAIGFDSWLYQYFIYETLPLSEETGYPTPPDYTIEESTEKVPDEGTIDSTDYEEYFAAVIEGLCAKDADEATCAELKALQLRFKADYDAFFDIIQDVPSFGADFYARYVEEANGIYENSMELYARRWSNIYKLEAQIKQALKANEYSEDNETVLKELSVSIQSAILGVYSVEDIEYLYNFYSEFIKGVPTKGEEDTFYAYRKAQVEGLETSFNAIDGTLYDEDVYAYLSEEYVAVSGEIGSAVSYEQIRDSLENWNRTVEKTVKKTGRAAFDAEKQEWIDKLRSYKEEDYEYSLWLNIEAFIERRIDLIETTFIIEDIRSYAEYGIEQIEAQESKLSTTKTYQIEALNKAINSFAMFSNLNDEGVKTLRYILNETEAQILAAKSIEEVYSLTDSGFDRIWRYYEYNQKGYSAYRQALAAFGSLDGETYAQAMAELQSISYRVAGNCDDILALIDRYCGGNSVNA